MSDITWADLDADEQRVMGVVKTYGYVLSDDEVDDGWVAPKCDPEVATRLQEYGLLLCLGKVSPYNYKYVFTPAGRALLPAGEAVDVLDSFESLDEAVDFWDKKLGKEAPPERLAQEYVDARQKAWDMGAAFVDYKTWLEQRLTGVEVQRDDALARAQAAEALLGTFGFIWHEWEATEDQRMGFSDWLHQHLDENPYLVDKFKAVDEHIRAVRIENLK